MAFIDLFAPGVRLSGDGAPCRRMSLLFWNLSLESLGLEESSPSGEGAVWNDCSDWRDWKDVSKLGVRFNEEYDTDDLSFWGVWRLLEVLLAVLLFCRLAWER